MAAADRKLSIPPLDIERFNESFKHFCSVKRLALDREPLYVEGEKVNLHLLHAEVMGHRGYGVREKRPDFWLKVGRDLGLIQSRDTSSASSETANRLARIYDRCLAEFDAIYVMSFMQELQHVERKAHAKLIG